MEIMTAPFLAQNQSIPTRYVIRKKVIYIWLMPRHVCVLDSTTRIDKKPPEQKLSKPGLTHWVQVVNAYRNPKVLWVDIFIPHKQLCTYGNVSKRSVVDVTTVLESKQVLLASVASTLYESHPARRVLVRCIKIIQKVAISVDLR